MKIVVIGAGYVGLVTGTCLAQKNNSVIIVEKNEEKISQLLNGKVPFHEPNLESLLKQAITKKTLQFYNSLDKALENNPELVFSCVGTPSLPNGSADLSAVFQVAKEFGSLVENSCIFINKSTVPVGTAQKINTIIKQEITKKQITIEVSVASNPEFLKEGSAVSDFLYPDRVVIGTNNNTTRQKLHDLYKPFLKNKDQFISMGIKSAELTKYASNAMLALRISFMNQLALLAEKVDADIEEIRKGMIQDKRIGKHFLNPGIGYGGSCFPKDVKALAFTGKEYNQIMTIIEATEKTNEYQKQWFAQKVIDYYKENMPQKTIGIWGLSFKPNTDDIRSAPSIDIITKLLETNCSIIAYDPIAIENIKSHFKNKINYEKTAKDVLKKSDCLLLLTEWEEFLQYQAEDFLVLKDQTIFDGRNCFNQKKMETAGIKYLCVGKRNKKDIFLQNKKINPTKNLTRKG